MTDAHPSADVAVRRDPAPRPRPRIRTDHLAAAAGVGAALLLAAAAVLAALHPTGPARWAAVFAAALGVSTFIGGVLTAVALLPTVSAGGTRD